MAIAVVLLCFYLRFKIKRAPCDVATPTDGNTSAVLRTISLHEDQAEDRHDRFPPRYSAVDHPPPYSLVSEPSQRSATVTGSLHTDLNTDLSYLLFVNTPNIS